MSESDAPDAADGAGECVEGGRGEGITQAAAERRDFDFAVLGSNPVRS